MKKLSKLEALTLTDDKLDDVVKIQGTVYDRKRKVSPKMATQMSKMLQKGKKLIDVAGAFDVTPHAVLYNTDPTYRAMHLSRCGKHTGTDHITVKNRVAYKRTLVAEGKLTAMV